MATVERSRGVRAPRRQGEGDRHRPLHRRPHLHRHGLREVPLRRSPARQDPADRHVEGAGAPGRGRGRHAGRPARRPVRQLRPGPLPVREGRRAVRGRDRRRRRGAHRGDRDARPPASSRSSTSRSRPSPTSSRRWSPDAPLVHPDLGLVRARTRTSSPNGNTMAYHTIVKGDADAAMASAEVVVKSRYASDASQGVPIEPRAVVAQWQGDKVTIWSSTQVPYAARAGVAQTLADPRGERAHRRAAPRRRVRREVRPALRGAGRGARASRAAAGAPRVLPRGGVQGDRAAPRGHRDGVRDRRDARRAPRRAPGEARARQGRVLRRGRVPRADGGDARVRPVRDRQRLRRGAPELHEQPAVRIGARADRAAGVLGRSSSTWTRSPPRSTWTPSSSVAAR